MIHPGRRELTGQGQRCADAAPAKLPGDRWGKAGIVNGTVGAVTGLSLEEQTLTVLSGEDEPVDYDFAELDELAHAYAITIHRSQGSEYPAVVIPLTASSLQDAQ